MSIDPKKTGPSAPQWENYSSNIVHNPPANGASYYFRPVNAAELKSILEDAVTKGITVRASGQRHSQTALVTNDNRDDASPGLTTYLVDMSCYADLGAPGNQVVLGPGPNQVTVNPGLREDALDAFLTQHNMMLETVTAGGFFSIGGMTAVDVHGGTVEAPIFAEAVASFTIMGADGNVTVIDGQSTDGAGNSLLQFVRVSLGALGIVTRIVLNVLPRPWANSLQGSTARLRLTTRSDFITEFKQLLTGPGKPARLEVFFLPYAAPVPLQTNFLLLRWDSVANPVPQIPNQAGSPDSACKLSNEGTFGAGVIWIPGFAEAAIIASQTSLYWWSPFAGPAVIAAIARDEIESQTQTANLNHSDLWLSKAQRVIFMSYFIEMPDLGDTGLGKVWDGMDVVTSYVLQEGNFHICAPMEFRIVKAGDSVMSGAFSTNRDAYFVNLDLIAFIEPTKSSDYPAALLKFFAHVERKWVAMGGLPHNGKMYGFYDPGNSDQDSYTPPFNVKFLSFITKQRSGTHHAPVEAFRKYRQSRDPNGLFYTQYLRDLLQD